MLWNLFLVGAALSWSDQASGLVTDQLAEICPALVALWDGGHDVTRGAVAGGENVFAERTHSFWQPGRYAEVRRHLQELNTAEDLRQIEDEWSRFWFTDQPSHLTYDRITGGLE